ncbi:hypothetical protein Sjap_006520 [Stephania japonica]|uniref:Uncharacterized protein n=1 Tax=Stephania japonica TaxID=461633 RepID=A0AAP0PJT9_9MAGN
MGGSNLMISGRHVRALLLLAMLLLLLLLTWPALSTSANARRSSTFSQRLLSTSELRTRRRMAPPPPPKGNPLRNYQRPPAYKFRPRPPPPPPPAPPRYGMKYERVHLSAASPKLEHPINSDVVQQIVRRSMKRAMPWSSKADESSSSSSSDSDSDSDLEDTVKHAKGKAGAAIDFKTLSRHGYKGGLSVLSMPPPKEEDKEPDWSWSNGKENASKREGEESYKDRQKTRDAIAEGEKLVHAQTRSEKEKAKEKNLSFSQKEKRKRDLGQASRGKSYVEEEKRLLRESGIYSGFDS